MASTALGRGVAGGRAKCLVGLVELLALLTGCGRGSWLGDDLAKQFETIDQAFARGDVDGACGLLPQAAAGLADVAEHSRGKIAVRMQQAYARLEGITANCGLAMLAPEKARGPRAVPSDWAPFYAELKRATVHKTGWLTVFSWVSMFVVGIGVYYGLRRLKSG
jgi:hypothetical protein